MFRNRERMVKVLGILLAAALAITLVLPFLGRT
jgi:cytochrome c-type biogenesis protein CcmE